MMINGETKKNVKHALSQVKEHLERYREFDPKTLAKVMKILEADIWCQFWQAKRDKLLRNESQAEKPNLEE
jgi:hypothetical protein